MEAVDFKKIGSVKIYRNILTGKKGKHMYVIQKSIFFCISKYIGIYHKPLHFQVYLLNFCCVCTLVNIQHNTYLNWEICVVCCPAFFWSRIFQLSDFERSPIVGFREADLSIREVPRRNKRSLCSIPHCEWSCSQEGIGAKGSGRSKRTTKRQDCYLKHLALKRQVQQYWNHRKSVA